MYLSVKAIALNGESAMSIHAGRRGATARIRVINSQSIYLPRS